MSTFNTAPPIYNTAGWGFRGDIPTFNHTGAFDTPAETGKITASVSDIQYFTKENKRDVNLEIDPTFNLNNLIAPRVDFEIDPSFSLNYLIAPRIDFEIKPNIFHFEESLLKAKVSRSLELQNLYKISSRLNLDRQINLQHSSIAFIEGKTFVRGIEDINYYSKSFIEGKNYNTTEANYYGNSFIKGKTFSQFGANYFSDDFAEGFMITWSLTYSLSFKLVLLKYLEIGTVKNNIKVYKITLKTKKIKNLFFLNITKKY